MMGFGTVQKFVHQLEGVFKRLIDTPGLLNARLMNSLFECATILKTAIEQIGTNPQPDLSQETAFLETLALERRARGQSSAGRRRKADVEDSPAREESRSAILAASGMAKTNMLRVDFERLDHLLNLTGELVIHKTKLNQIAKNIEELVGAEEFFGDLPAVAQMVDKTTAELQDAIMRVRMLPIRNVFQRFPRMVRDLAKQKGKEIELSLSGEDTEIDKTVIDALGDPVERLADRHSAMERRVAALESQLETDQFLRTLGWAHVVQQELAQMDPDSLAFFKKVIETPSPSGYESQIRNQWEGTDRTKPVDCGTGGIFREVVAQAPQLFSRPLDFRDFIALHPEHQQLARDFDRQFACRA